MDFKTFSKLIMIEQTLFALPFALTAVVLASYQYSVTVTKILLIVVVCTHE